jgi:integrase
MPSYKLRRSGPLKNWYAFYSIERRSKSWSTGTTDKPLAIKRADAYFALLYAKKDADPEDMTVSDVLLRYKNDRDGEFASPTTAAYTISHLAKYYGGSTVADINASTNKTYELDMRAVGWSNSTINRSRNTLRAALKHAVKDGKLRYAPFVPTLKVGKGKERWLTYDEALRLYRAVRHWRWRYMNLFIRIGLGTGARHKAILSLKWDQIDLEHGRIDFRVPGRVETKKRRPNAPINDRLLRLLRAAEKVREGDHVIMHRGGPLLSVKKAFGEACERAELPGVTPHTLKHTYITWLLRSGVSLWDVAGLTSTSAVTIEKVYGHHAKDRLKSAANAVNSAELVPNGSSKKAQQEPLSP